jgi:sec-independent protein translocase protein TatC
VQQITTLKEYFSFLTLMLMLFGLAFEFPVLLVFLNLVGVLSYERMKRWHRPMAFLVYLAAAILTPSTDPFTFLFLGTALFLLWWGSVGIAWLRSRRSDRRPAPEGFDVADDDTSYIDTSPSQL